MFVDLTNVRTKINEFLCQKSNCDILTSKLHHL